MARATVRKIVKSPVSPLSEPQENTTQTSLVTPENPLGLSDEDIGLPQDPSHPIGDDSASGASAQGTTEPLPRPPSSKPTFDQACLYLKSLPAKQRRRITIYVYRLFPVINTRYADPPNLPKGKQTPTNIDKLMGEYPLSSAEDVLGLYGAGDYFFRLNDLGRGNVPVCTFSLMGYTNGVPGFRDYNKNPPLISDLATVVLDDPRNLSTGYISFLQQKGLIPSTQENATTSQVQHLQQLNQEREDAMAAEQSNAMAAMAGTLGTVVKSVIERDSQRSDPKEADTERIWNSADKAIKMVTDNAANPLEQLQTAADVLQKLIPKQPDNNPVIEKIMDQNAELNTRISSMQGEQLSEMRAELREMRREASAARTAVVQGVGMPKTALEQIQEVKQFVDAIKGVVGGGDEDAPARYAAPAALPPPPPAKGMIEMLFENLPQLIQGGVQLIDSVVRLRGQQAQVQAPPQQYQYPAPYQPYPTGPGLPQYAPPPAPVPMPQPQAQPQAFDGPGLDPRADPLSAPMGAQPNPIHYAAAPQGQPQPHQYAPPPPTPATPQTPEQAAQAQKIQLFFALQTLLRAIEVPLVTHLEQEKTGYEFAQWYIMTYKRLGAYGYDKLRSNSIEDGKKQALELVSYMEPGNHAEAPQGLYPALWGQVGGNKEKLTAFLSEFVTYDLFLAEHGVATWTDYLLQEGEEDEGDDAGADAETGDGVAIAAVPVSAALKPRERVKAVAKAKGNAVVIP